ncbi:hypothetical protein SAMN04487982_10142 [Streptomyces sp. ok210]|nr:hypothetical protein SAMN04487982_10142 [Streptomyces sp. ok210]
MTNPVLLVMDVQQAITERVPDPGFTPRLARAVAAAGTVGLPVVYVVLGFRPGHPEAKSSPSFGALPDGTSSKVTPEPPSTPTSHLAPARASSRRSASAPSSAATSISSCAAAPSTTSS